MWGREKYCDNVASAMAGVKSSESGDNFSSAVGGVKSRESSDIFADAVGGVKSNESADSFADRMVGSSRVEKVRMITLSEAAMSAAIWSGIISRGDKSCATGSMSGDKVMMSSETQSISEKLGSVTIGDKLGDMSISDKEAG